MDRAMRSGVDADIEAAEEALTAAMDNLADEMKALAKSRHRRRASVGDALRNPEGTAYGFGSPDASSVPEAESPMVKSVPGSPSSTRKSLQQQNEELFEEAPQRTGLTLNEPSL